MQFDNDYDGDDDKVDDVPMFDYNIDSSEQMNEHMAALVLTSLSCSPASPAYMSGVFSSPMSLVSLLWQINTGFLPHEALPCAHFNVYRLQSGLKWTAWAEPQTTYLQPVFNPVSC